jgi:hypothetical protein
MLFTFLQLTAPVFSKYRSKKKIQKLSGIASNSLDRGTRRSFEWSVPRSGKINFTEVS